MAQKKIGKQCLVNGQMFDLVCGEEQELERQESLYAIAEGWSASVPFRGHERRLTVDIREFNKLGAFDGDIVAAGDCKIFVDDFQVYSFMVRHAEDALIHAWSVIDRLKGFSRSVFRTELFAKDEVNSLLVNRKVYLNNIPAVVDQFWGSGTVNLICATEQGSFPFTAKELGYKLSEDGRESRKAVDILSSDICWFRED